MFTKFLEENFFYLHPGYTAFNTIIFGIVLALIIIAIIKLFEKLGKHPLELLYPLIPMIIFGSTSRALVDNHIYPRIHLLATPGIYIFIGLLTIIILITSIYLEKYFSVKYYKIIFVMGLIFCIPNIILIIQHGINFNIFLFEILLWLIVSSPFFYFKKDFLKKYNREILSAHIFDATTTYVALDYFGYAEQHVLPTFMINLTGTALIMYPLKIGINLLILYVIDKEIESGITSDMLKLSIFILGLAPGIRNFTTLILAMS